MKNGFTYNGIHSSQFNIVADRETHSILPEQRKYQVMVPGRDGVVDFGIGGYGTRLISFDIYYEGDFVDLRYMTDQIAAWLASPKGEYRQLSFDDKPNRYYLAKLTSPTDFRNATNRRIGALTFECNPPWVFEDGIALTPDQVSWNTAELIGNEYIQAFASNGNMRFTLTGAIPVKPIIRLIGKVPSGTTLTYSDKTWIYTTEQTWDGIEIDCANETVTRMSDGANLYPYMSGDFFEFSPGKIEISVEGNFGNFPNNLTVVIEVIPTYGV
jgi:predicted phage tail component-like protein